MGDLKQDFPAYPDWRQFRSISIRETLRHFALFGSGAAGGQPAFTLAMEAMVLILEADSKYDPVTETQKGGDAGWRPLESSAATPHFAAPSQ
jgi:hypothetical protein